MVKASKDAAMKRKSGFVPEWASSENTSNLDDEEKELQRMRQDFKTITQEAEIFAEKQRKRLHRIMQRNGTYTNAQDFEDQLKMETMSKVIRPAMDHQAAMTEGTTKEEGVYLFPGFTREKSVRPY